MTMTQPVEPRATASNRVPVFNETYRKFEERVRICAFEGGVLDCAYQESFPPSHSTPAYLEFEVKFDIAGAFFFQLRFYDEEIKGFNFTKAQYLNVEPSLRLRVGGQERAVNLKQISLQTLLPRQMGVLSTWPQVIQNSVQCGYNMIHLAPFQVYGESRSHYSIADQTRVDGQFLAGEEALEED